MAVTRLVTSDPWISCPSPNPEAKLRLFGFPYAGGGAATYFPWIKLLRPEVGLYAIRLPGRENRVRERAYLRLTPLIDEMVEVVTPYLDQPFAFFGHSMGSLLAFELGRALREKGLPQPLHLFTSGYRAPHLPDMRPLLYQLPDERFVTAMHERYNGIPRVVLENEELLKLFLPIMRADVTILDTYQYHDAPPLACPITTYGGEQDPSVALHELRAWQTQTDATFRLIRFAGGHFYLQDALPNLLQDIQQELARYL
ncbi:MAG: thioesterase [Caldilineaceae bacterium]|nr:thioesterase [Caldilineaceae bacterium]